MHLFSSPGGRPIAFLVVVFCLWWVACLAAVDLGAEMSFSPEEDYRVKRQQMVQHIRRLYRVTGLEDRLAEVDAGVLAVMGKVPRHLFVPERLSSLAYQDRALPIGSGQTISQPFIVALMTQLARSGEKPLGTVLEVGTGCGYQAAVLAGLAERVYSIEILEELGIAARSRLAKLGYANVQVRIGDGYQGWSEHAPFDAIVVTAAPAYLPPPLLEQLKFGGKLVIPVGRQGGQQSLQVVTRAADGSYPVEKVLPVSFVPLTRENPP